MSPGGCIIFSSCQQDIRVPISFHPSQHLVLQVLHSILLSFYFAFPWWASFHVPIDHLFSIVKCLFMSFAHFFFIELFAFLLVSCSSSLYVLNASLLSEICIVNTFSQAVVCLFRAGGFNPDKISFLWCPAPHSSWVSLDSLQSFFFLLCRSACPAPRSNFV